MAAPEHMTDEQVEKLGLKIQDEVKTHLSVVRPGDTMVFSFAYALNMEQYENLTNFCKTLLPGVNVIAIPDVQDVRVFRPRDPEEM